MTAKKKINKRKKIKRALEIAEELKGLKLSIDQLKEVAGGSSSSINFNDPNDWSMQNGCLHDSATGKTYSNTDTIKLLAQAEKQEGIPQGGQSDFNQLFKMLAAMGNEGEGAPF